MNTILMLPAGVTIEAGSVQTEYTRLLPHVSRDNNLYVVGDISRKCLDTTETNNYRGDGWHLTFCINGTHHSSELGGYIYFGR